jgi:hypothetical protein
MNGGERGNVFVVFDRVPFWFGVFVLLNFFASMIKNVPFALHTQNEYNST